MCDVFSQPLNYSTLKKRMSSFPKVNINFSLVVLLQPLCGRCVPWNKIISFNPAAQIFVSFWNKFPRNFQFRLFFHVSQPKFNFLRVNRISVWTWWVEQSLKVGVFIADTGFLFQKLSIHDCGFFNWTEKIWAHTFKPHRTKVQHSGHMASSHASYLIV